MSAAEKLDFINIMGKDWLTVEEAAFYCGVSVAQFNAKAPDLGLAPRNFMGKKLYEKAALYRSISGSSQWQRSPSTGATVSHISTGARPAGAVASPLGGSAAEKLRKYEQRKKRN